MTDPHGEWKFLTLIAIPGPQSLIPIPIPAQFDFVDSDSSRNVTDSRIGIVHHWLRASKQYFPSRQGNKTLSGFSTVEYTSTVC